MEPPHEKRFTLLQASRGFSGGGSSARAPNSFSRLGSAAGSSGDHRAAGRAGLPRPGTIGSSASSREARERQNAKLKKLLLDVHRETSAVLKTVDKEQKYLDGLWSSSPPKQIKSVLASRSHRHVIKTLTASDKLVMPPLRTPHGNLVTQTAGSPHHPIILRSQIMKNENTKHLSGVAAGGHNYGDLMVGGSGAGGTSPTKAVSSSTSSTGGAAGASGGVPPLALAGTGAPHQGGGGATTTSCVEVGGGTTGAESSARQSGGVGASGVVPPRGGSVREGWTMSEEEDQSPLMIGSGAGGPLKQIAVQGFVRNDRKVYGEGGVRARPASANLARRGGGGAMMVPSAPPSRPRSARVRPGGGGGPGAGGPTPGAAAIHAKRSLNGRLRGLLDVHLSGGVTGGRGSFSIKPHPQRTDKSQGVDGVLFPRDHDLLAVIVAGGQTAGGATVDGPFSNSALAGVPPLEQKEDSAVWNQQTNAGRFGTAPLTFGAADNRTNRLFGSLAPGMGLVAFSPTGGSGAVAAASTGVVPGGEFGNPASTGASSSHQHFPPPEVVPAVAGRSSLFATPAIDSGDTASLQIGVRKVDTPFGVQLNHAVAKKVAGEELMLFSNPGIGHVRTVDKGAGGTRPLSVKWKEKMEHESDFISVRPARFSKVNNRGECPRDEKGEQRGADAALTSGTRGPGVVYTSNRLGHGGAFGGRYIKKTSGSSRPVSGKAGGPLPEVRPGSAVVVRPGNS